jgi:hypothetical protein
MKNRFILLILSCLAQSALSQTCTKGNCVNGFGTFKYANNSSYSGEFKQGKRHGKGIYYYANSNKYLGDWQNDLRVGEGKLSYANGDVYTGLFANDKMEGQGTMEFSTGDMFSGTWKNGKPDGRGIYFFRSGERYEGDFTEARFEGNGMLFYKNGCNYKGQWKAGKKEGYGEFRNASGKTITAMWSDDKILKILDDTNEDEVIDPVVNTLPGTFTSASKDLADNNTNDQLKEILTHKPFTHTEDNSNSNKTTSSSDYKDTYIHLDGQNLTNCNAIFCAKGKGIFTYGDGSKFVGEFLEGEPKGRGTCYYANGDRYEGFWENHAPHGEGVMYFSSGLSYGAIWKHGKSIREVRRKQEFIFDSTVVVDRSPEVKIWVVIIGIARYEHMPALKYSDDDAYKMYAFFKSPEGGALKDEQIRILIDEEANRINILKTLNQVFMKADENDVVMMYFSGHGLEGTFIPIDYDGFSNLLKHDEVKDIINRSKAKHKVCFTDACHSGSLLATKSPYSNSSLHFYEEFDKSSGGIAFLMSSKSKEFSLEDGGLRQGVFSHFLIKGLKGAADVDGNKTITIKELFNYVYKHVREYTARAQSPMIAGEYDENMPIGIIR